MHWIGYQLILKIQILMKNYKSSGKLINQNNLKFIIENQNHLGQKVHYQRRKSLRRLRSFKNQSEGRELKRKKDLMKKEKNRESRELRKCPK